MIRTGSTLPAAIAAGALFAAPGVSVAHAETAPPKHVRAITEQQQLRNEQARAKVVALAKLVINGPAEQRGGQQNYTNSLTGERFGVQGVDIQADTLSGTIPGQYSFRVTAPLNKHNRLKLNDVSSVNIIEGTTENTWVGAYFSVNPKDHDAVAFHAIYQDPGNVYGSEAHPTQLDAYTDPSADDLARLTPKRLISAINKSVLIVEAAERRDPTGQAGRMKPPFTQPPGTFVGMK